MLDVFAAPGTGCPTKGVSARRPNWPCIGGDGVVVAGRASPIDRHAVVLVSSLEPRRRFDSLLQELLKYWLKLNHHLCRSFLARSNGDVRIVVRLVDVSELRDVRGGANRSHVFAVG